MTDMNLMTEGNNVLYFIYRHTVIDIYINSYNIFNTHKKHSKIPTEIKIV